MREQSRAKPTHRLGTQKHSLPSPKPQYSSCPCTIPPQLASLCWGRDAYEGRERQPTSPKNNVVGQSNGSKYKDEVEDPRPAQDRSDGV